MRRRAYKALALLPALILIGCGSGGTNVGGGNEAPEQTGEGGGVVIAFDPRDEPIGCFASKGVETEKHPEFADRINVLPVTSGAYVVFATTPAEAQGRALKDDADASGAEVIGPALFTVGDLPDDVAAKVEDCLDARGVRY